MYAFFVKYGFIFELLLSFFLFTYSLKKRRFYGFRILASVGVLFLYAFFARFHPQSQRLDGEFEICGAL